MQWWKIDNIDIALVYLEDEKNRLELNGIFKNCTTECAF